MRELIQYIATANRIQNQLGQPEYDLNVFWHRLALSQQILKDLSPENLSCDGEFAPGGWRARQREMFLTRALEQLEFLEEHEMKHAMLAGGEFPMGDYND